MTFPCDARAIANEFLDMGDLSRTPLTNMALQKLVYLAHGWLLEKEGKPLATNHFEAWRHGPVVRALFDSLKAAGERPVVGRAMWFNALDNRVEVARAQFSDSERAFLRRVFEAYGHLSAFELSDITHVRGGPWDRVWNAESGQVFFDQRIPGDLISSYFHRHVDSCEITL